MNAYVYLRVSGLAQVEGEGFPRQLAACEAYAAQHGMTIAHVYREEGVTGKSELDGRPALSDLMQAMTETGIKTVIIEKLDRLARDLMISESIIGDFQRRGFTLISIHEPDLCSTDPTRVLMRQMMAAFFQYERSMIVSKLADARRRTKHRQGRCEGRKPYGFYLDESSTLTAMLSMRANGYKYRQIAQRLNGDGIKPRHGALWKPNVVGKIIQYHNSRPESVQP